MRTAPLPSIENDRLRALAELEIMDTGAESEFDEIVQLASQICDTPISLITLLDERRQWFKARTGLDAMETGRNIAFCAHAILDDKIMEVKNALLDDRFHDNPLVTQAPNIRFYAGIPLTTSGGFNLGTLCVIDTVPRELNPLQMQALTVLSHQVIKQLEIRIQRRKIEQQSVALRKLNDSNAKLLSIISHDLRSPLSTLHQIVESYQAGHMSAEDTNELIRETDFYVEGSLALLDNLMSWARQQFHNEEICTRQVNVVKILHDIVRPFTAAIEAKSNQLIIHAEEVNVTTNENILRLLVRNLVVNANKFTQNGQIKLTAKITAATLHIAVTDTGLGMTPTQIDHLFSWEKRRSTDGTSGEKGLGIGLQLCKEMVDAAGGNLRVESTVGQGATFHFALPVLQNSEAAIS